MWIALRLALLSAGVFCGWLAWSNLTGGEPPAWSWFAPRAETVVTLSEEIDEPTPGSGGHHRAHIEVAWPPGANTSAELVGLITSHDRWHLHAAGPIVAAHPVGSAVTVRIVRGLPMADRTDIIEMANAIGLGLIALMLTAIALRLFLRRPRTEDQT